MIRYTFYSALEPFIRGLLIRFNSIGSCWKEKVESFCNAMLRRVILCVFASLRVGLIKLGHTLIIAKTYIMYFLYSCKSVGIKKAALS
jgi:hypothetical protein